MTKKQLIEMIKRVIREENSKDELNKKLAKAQQNLEYYTQKNQNSMHPFEPSKKMSDFVKELQIKIKSLQAKLDNL